MATCGVEQGQGGSPPRVLGFGHRAVIFACIIFLAALTCAHQARELGWTYLSTQEIERHEDVLAGRAGSPWQYRVLTVYINEGAIRCLAAAGVSNPQVLAFLAMRLVQNIGIMLLAYVLYRRIGGNWAMGLIGISVLAWAMTYCLWGSGLRMHTYGDILIYLLAALAIFSGRYGWIVLIAAVGSANRESSILVPVMLLGEALLVRRAGGAWKRLAVLAGAAMLIFVAIQLALRWAYPPQQLLGAGVAAGPGLDLLRWNVTTLMVWRNLAMTFGIIPLAALLGWRCWPGQIKAWFWIIVPIWLVTHYVGAVVAHTSLLLVPLTIILIPGLLAAARRATVTIPDPKNSLA